MLERTEISKRKTYKEYYKSLEPMDLEDMIKSYKMRLKIMHTVMKETARKDTLDAYQGVSKEYM